MTVDETPHEITRHGLYYRSRDGQHTYQLDFNAEPPYRWVPDRPELDVAIAVVRYALERLEADLARATVDGGQS